MAPNATLAPIIARLMLLIPASTVQTSAKDIIARHRKSFVERKRA
jgi:hypothetical protein